MKKIILFLAVCTLGVQTNSFAQTQSETLVSNVWLLDHVVINGDTLQKPDVVNIQNLMTGQTIAVVSNAVKLEFAPVNASVYKVTSNLILGSKSAHYFVTDTSIAIDESAPFLGQSGQTGDDLYDEFKSTFLNSFTDFYGDGSYTITNNQLRLGNATTYGVYNVYSLCATYPIPIGASSQTLIQGQTLSSLVVSGISGTTLKWFSDADLITEIPANTVATNATYYVVQSDDNCTSLPLIVNVTIDTAAELDSYQLENIKIYPNPIQDDVTISYSNSIDKIEIFDITGRKILSNIYQDKELNLNISNFNSGIYFFKIYTSDGFGVKKVIKK